jgi:uncharacterized damage-inducible protein DinB
MKMIDLFLAELDREAAATRRTLERVPDGRPDWTDFKPHERSMPMGYLATLVATMPSWVTLTIDQDEFDIAPPGKPYQPPLVRTSRELVEMYEGHLTKAREALLRTTDEHLMKPWKLLAGGQAVIDQPRHEMLRDGVLNHLWHHRGQLTVYLRLTGAKVPAIYGQSADEGRP